VVRSEFLQALGRSPKAPPRLAADHPPLLLVVVDTEEEFDWSRPHARENTGVSAIGAQGRAQEVFARHGIAPTPELERAKLEALTAAIAAGFGSRPVVYKAGRYGVGPATAGILEQLGYLIDVSVVPYTSFSGDGGPDFSQAGFQPSWFGSDGTMLEIPLSCGFHGVLRSLGPAVYPYASSPLGMRVRLPGMLARSGLLERIRLTPEGVDLAANLRLARSLFQQGCRIFSFTYHSPSLVPGMTPYVRSEGELAIFLDTMDRFFRFFREELGGRPSDPLEVYSLLRQGQQQAERQSAGAQLNQPAQ